MLLPKSDLLFVTSTVLYNAADALIYRILIKRCLIKITTVVKGQKAGVYTVYMPSAFFFDHKMLLSILWSKVPADIDT